MHCEKYQALLSEEITKKKKKKKKKKTCFRMSSAEIIFIPPCLIMHNLHTFICLFYMFFILEFILFMQKEKFPYFLWMDPPLLKPSLICNTVPLFSIRRQFFMNRFIVADTGKPPVMFSSATRVVSFLVLQVIMSIIMKTCLFKYTENFTTKK